MGYVYVELHDFGRLCEDSWYIYMLHITCMMKVTSERQFFHRTEDMEDSGMGGAPWEHILF